MIKEVLGLKSCCSCRELEIAIGKLDSNNSGEFSKLLRFSSVDKSDADLIVNIYNKAESGELFLNPDIYGLIGFFLFSYFANKYRDDKKKYINHKNQASLYLRGEKVLNFIRQEYSIPSGLIDLKPEYLELHEVGTTSFIINYRNKYAIKIIKPTFIDNPYISQQTKEYHNKYADYVYLPRIHHSNNRCIVMDFLEGKSLREYIDKNIHLEKNITKKLGYIKETIDKLCNALDHLHSNATQSVIHGDLSPENIIIDKNDGIHLIDLGVNYLLTEGVNQVTAFTQIQVYIAPEVKINPNSVTIKSDIFSLGIILLEMLGKEKILSENLSEYFDKAWEEYPELAKIISNLVDSCPDHRLLEISDCNKLYLSIRSQIEVDFSLLRDLLDIKYKCAFSGKIQYREIIKKNTSIRESIERERNKLNSITKGYGQSPTEDIHQSLSKIIPNYSINNGDQVDGHWQKHENEIKSFLNLIDTLEARHREIMNVLRWSKITNVINSLLVLIFLIFVFDDFGILGLIENIGLFNIPGGDYLVSVIDKINSGDWKSNLWGRLVAISFSLTATQYYLNIFQALSVPKQMSNTNFWLRINSFCFSIPILVALIIEPSWWPFCSAVGVWFVAANNYYSYISAKIGSEVERNEFSLPPSTAVSNFLHRFRSWFIGMFWYGLFLIIIGALIEYGIAKDVVIYALSISTINIVFLYINASTYQADKIRGGLMRLFFSLTRYEIKKRKQFI